MSLRLERVPIETPQPILVLAALRVVLVLVALGSVLALGLPFGGQLALVLAILALPWAVTVLVVTRRSPGVGLTPWIAIGDMVMLAVVELVVPEAYGVVRFGALFIIAAHAHFQGERRGIAIAAVGVALLALAALVTNDAPVSGDVLALYEVLFAASALGVALILGRLRTAESTGRLRARELSRRTMGSETELRRSLAESIHDGPVQELVSLDMMLSAAEQAARKGNNERLDAILHDARQVTGRNIQTLRDEITGLGPYAFEELSFQTAVEECLPVWRRRFDLDVGLDLEPLELPSYVEESLFRIVQEAVVNAGRHSGAGDVRVSLRRYDGQLELRIEDDGHGFGAVDPLEPGEPGHIGLTSMRERAELVFGTLEIHTDGRGTAVVVTLPAFSGSRGA